MLSKAGSWDDSGATTASKVGRSEANGESIVSIELSGKLRLALYSWVWTELTFVILRLLTVPSSVETWGRAEPPSTHLRHDLGGA